MPDNRNLSPREIDDFITKVTDEHSINAVVTTYKPQTNTLLYINSKIKKMKKQKSKLITILNTLRQVNNHTGVSSIKAMIDKININLKAEFGKAYTAYWETQYKSINHRDTDCFFPKINRWFRQKKPLDIQSLLIHQDDVNILNKHFDTNKLVKSDDEFVVNDPYDKLNVIGSFYEKINSARYTNNGTNIKKQSLKKPTFLNKI